MEPEQESEDAWGVGKEPEVGFAKKVSRGAEVRVISTSLEKAVRTGWGNS